MTFLRPLRLRTAETLPTLSRFVKIGYQLHQLAVKLVVYLLIDLFAEQFSSVLVSPLFFRIGRFKKRVKLCLVLYRSVAVKRVVPLILFGYKSDIIVFSTFASTLFLRLIVLSSVLCSIRNLVPFAVAFAIPAWAV